jgi:hypothetical protein
MKHVLGVAGLIVLVLIVAAVFRSDEPLLSGANEKWLPLIILVPFLGAAALVFAWWRGMMEDRDAKLREEDDKMIEYIRRTKSDS